MNRIGGELEIYVDDKDVLFKLCGEKMMSFDLETGLISLPEDFFLDFFLGLMSEDS